MDFEAEREANIARNKAMLEELGLKDNCIIVKKTKPIPSKGTKRKPHTNEEVEEQEAPEKPARKVHVAIDADDTPSAGPRRSSRNANKRVDYAGDGDMLEKVDGPKILTEKARKAAENEPKGVQDRKHDPKTFGAIPGVAPGTWWETRKDCSIDAIHAPWVAGISGGPDGCYSVALSGGYEDDVDLGEAFTYTGSGGRDLKGTKNSPKNLRTAPQSFDQTFETKDNRALLKSVETKKAVRVIRGYKLHSKYAPPEGYRYDGLYTVEKAWREKGLNSGGYQVCKFIFKRIPGQPPLPVYEENEDAEGDDDEESETIVASEPISEKDE